MPLLRRLRHLASLITQGRSETSVWSLDGIPGGPTPSASSKTRVRLRLPPMTKAMSVTRHPRLLAQKIAGTQTENGHRLKWEDLT